MPEEDFNKYLDSAVLNRLMAQSLLTPLPMEGTVSGHHKSPHRGSSVEFAEYRNYVPGDDLRRLDWRVFGRTDRFYLKEFEAETNLRCCVVLDCSGSMSFSGAGEARFEYARRIAATLAYMVIHQGDAAGLVCVSEKIATEVPARRNPAHLRTVLGAINSAQSNGETGLVAALHELAERVRRRALVVVISDLFCDPEELLGAVQHLRFQKHDVAVFHLLDRMEVDFEFDRPVRFVDLETRQGLVAEPSIVREQYLEQLNLFLERLRTGCHEFKVDYRRIITDESYERVLANFLVDRARSAAVGGF